ncbi:unnamed protein product [Penicillium pancosmium]
MAISKVAVAGGTGNLGPAIVNALLTAGFEVTVLSRSSSHKLDPRVKVQEVDYNSQDSLTTALSNQDAVVNALGVGVVAREIHLRLVEAAHAAKVKRFIPSEFGSDTVHHLTAQLPVFGDKVAVLERLKEISAQDQEFSYTAVINGPFFDWGLEKQFFLNLAGPTTEIYDGGDVPVSTTTLPGIGRAVAGVLQKPDETKNRPVYVAETVFTQNKLLEWSGKADKIEKVPVTTEELEQKAYEAIKQPTPDGATFARNLILRAIFGGKFGGHFSKTDNELLGVKELSESEIKDLVKEYV